MDLPNNYNYLAERFNFELARSARGRLERIFGFKRRITPRGHWPALYQCGDTILCEINRYYTDRRIEVHRQHIMKVRKSVAMAGLLGLGMAAADPMLSLYKIIGGSVFIAALVGSIILWLPERAQRFLKRIFGKVTVVAFYENHVHILPSGFGYSIYPRPRTLKIEAGHEVKINFDDALASPEKRSFWQRFFDLPGRSDASEDIAGDIHTIKIKAGLKTAKLMVYDVRDASAITDSLRAAESLRARLAYEDAVGVPEFVG